MTKEITKANILQQIQDKFELRELIPEKFAFSEMVIPTYNIEQHLLTPKVMIKTVSVTASGVQVMFTVPESEKWHLHRYNVIFVTGSYKIAGVLITRPTGSEYMYLDLTLNQTLSYAHDLPKDVVLFPHEDISINVDDYTSTGNLLMHADVTVEKIR